MTSPHITNQQKNSMKKCLRIGFQQLVNLLRSGDAFLPGLKTTSAARSRLATIVENDQLGIEAVADWSEQASSYVSPRRGEGDRICSRLLGESNYAPVNSHSAS